MNKTAISGVLWGATKAKSLVNPHKVSDEQLAESAMADADKQRAIDLLDRARIRSARGRHNSEGFGE